MDSLDNLTPTQPDLNELQAQVTSLRQAVVTALVLVLVLSATANIALWRSFKNKRGELAQMSQRIQDFNKWEGTLAKNLFDYGRTHADFAYIMTKYQIKDPAKSSTLATPAPAAKTAAPAAKTSTPASSAKKP